MPYPAVVLLLFALAALRLPSNFVYPAFWAEDATVFFRQSVELGPAALLRPVYGSYHMVPRLIAWLASFFPVAWAPALYALAAGLLASASLALFSRPGFRWLVPNDLVRVLVCVLSSLVPGTNESTFVLCGLNYTMFVGVVWLILERGDDGAWRMGPARALLVSFLWFSIGQGLVLAPALLLLFWLTRNRNYLLCLAVLGLTVALNVGTDNPYRPTRLPHTVALLRVYVNNIFIRLAFIPVFGRRGIDRVFDLRYVLYLSIPTLLILGYLLAVRRRRALDAAGARVLAATILGGMALFPLIALVRDYSLRQLRIKHFLFEGRYSLVPSVFALLLLYVWLARPARSVPRRAAAAVFLSWTTMNLLLEPLHVPPEPFRPFLWEWPQQAATIEQALRDKKAGRLRQAVVVTDIHPRPHFPTWKVQGLTISP